MVASVVAGQPIVVNIEALPLIVALAVLILLPLAAPPIDDIASVAVVVYGAEGIRHVALASLCPLPAARLPT